MLSTHHSIPWFTETAQAEKVRALGFPADEATGFTYFALSRVHFGRRRAPAGKSVLLIPLRSV